MRSALLTLALLGSLLARATVPICVEVKGASLAHPEEYRSYVTSEVRRHPGHVPVDEGCQSTLHIEIAQLAQRGWATGWLDGQVPARVEVPTPSDLEAALGELVTKVLGSDPVALAEDLDRYLAALSAAEASAVAGSMLYGLEAFQTVARTGDGAAYLPGLALRVRRGLGSFHVGARSAVSFLPGSVAEGHAPRMTVLAVLEPEFAWFVSQRSTASFYLGAALGVSVVRFDGNRKEFGKENLVDWGMSASVRAGVEMMRASDWRIDLFVEGSLPMFVTNSTETNLVNAWTPSVHAGLGVAF